MTILIDSSVLIDVLNGRKGRPELLARLIAGGNVLATSAVNVAEVYTGMRPREQGRTDALIADLAVYDTTRAIGHRAGLLRNEAARRGQTLGLADTIIAATALEYGLMVMTDNRKDFPMEGLRLFDLPPG
jgi:predicted nucleic acid-binding protein